MMGTRHLSAQHSHMDRIAPFNRVLPAISQL